MEATDNLYVVVKYTFIRECRGREEAGLRF